MRQGIIISMAACLALAGAGSANAQVGAAPSGPLPGSVDSARASSESREATAAYNERMGSGDLKSNNHEDKAKKKGAGPATAADIKAGAALRDVKGVPIGSIVSVDDKQAVVDTGQTKIGVPLIGFGKDDKGLLLNITADQFNQAIAKAHAKSQAAHYQASH